MARTNQPDPKQPADAKSLALRATSGYIQWVDRLAAHNRSTRAGLIDQALARFAKETGFAEAPPER